MSETNQSIGLKLGDRIFSDLSITKEEDWGMMHNRNSVYINALQENGIDKTQFTYDPDRKWFNFGKVIQRASSSTDQGEETFYNVYLKPFIVSQDGSIIEDGSEGGSIEGGGSSTILTIGSGTGIKIDNSNPQIPIISIDTKIVPTKEKVDELDATVDDLQDKIKFILGTDTPTPTTSNNPDIAALLTLLDVMEVEYEEDPVGETSSLTESLDSGSVYTTKGIRFKWVNDDFVCNCIRCKNITTGGSRYNGNIFLKVVECDVINEISNEYGYAAKGDAINTVSSNSLNLYQNNNVNEFYEWYFPKKVILRNNKVYAIIPHHDKTYDKVTQSNVTFVIHAANNINTSTDGITGVWTSDRNIHISNSVTPLLEFCNKIPTTIIMKR